MLTCCMFVVLSGIQCCTLISCYIISDICLQPHNFHSDLIFLCYGHILTDPHQRKKHLKKVTWFLNIWFSPTKPDDAVLEHDRICGIWNINSHFCTVVLLVLLNRENITFVCCDESYCLDHFLCWLLYLGSSHLKKLFSS